MAKYSGVHSIWPERAARESHSPERNAGLRAGVAIVIFIFSIAAFSIADMAGWQPSSPRRIERQIVSDTVPTGLIALRSWSQQQQEVRAPMDIKIVPAVVKIASVAVKSVPARVELSGKELTFKYGYARRQAALPQMVGTLLTERFPGAAVQARPQEAVRVHSGLRNNRNVAKVRDLREAQRVANRDSQSQIRHVVERAGAAGFGNAGIRSFKFGRPFAASFDHRHDVISLRTPSGLY